MLTGVISISMLKPRVGTVPFAAWDVYPHFDIMHVKVLAVGADRSVARRRFHV